MDHTSITKVLADAGCIAPAEEAGELMDSAGEDPGRLVELVRRRAGGEPLAWLTGSIEFCSLQLSLDPGVYVPRWQTEPMARRAAALLPPGGVGVDICTGAGPIAAVMARAIPTARVIATEIDGRAARCAQANGVEVLRGHLDDPLPPQLEQRVDVLAAVVPYVPTDALRLLPRDVQAFEPLRALDGGVDGVDLLAEVACRSARWLRPGGWLLLELGGDQAEPVERLLRELGFADAEITVDEEGDPRSVCARLGRGRPAPEVARASFG